MKTFNRKTAKATEKYLSPDKDTIFQFQYVSSPDYGIVFGLLFKRVEPGSSKFKRHEGYFPVDTFKDYTHIEDDIVFMADT